MKRIDLRTEAIDPQLRACLEQELVDQPGSRVIKRKGHLFFKTKRGFEILVQHLDEAKWRWVETGVEHVDLPVEQKWVIFNLLIHGNARLEHVPGLGLKATLPARARQ